MSVTQASSETASTRMRPSHCIFFFHRNKFVEFDMKPVCKKCYEKFPLELKKRLKKLAESLGRK